MVEGVSDSDISDIRIMLNHFNDTITGMASFVAETNNRLSKIDEIIQQRDRISISNGSTQKVGFLFTLCSIPNSIIFISSHRVGYPDPLPFVVM